MAVLQRRHPVQVHLPPWGVFVAESAHASEFQAETMRHDYLKVIYVLRGQGTLDWKRTSLPCRAGDVFIMPIGQTHRICDTPAAPLTLYFVCVSPWLLERDATLARGLPQGHLASDGALSETVRTTLRRMLYEHAAGQPGYAGMLQGLALQLLAHLARYAPGHAADADTAASCRTIVKQYIRQLEGNFFEISDLDTVARQLGMSRRRFTQLFRDITGQSWGRFIQHHRIQHAKHLLATTPRTTLAIAFECGFNDPSTFYRAFQRHEHCSPQTWRKQSHPSP